MIIGILLTTANLHAESNHASLKAYEQLVGEATASVASLLGLCLYPEPIRPADHSASVFPSVKWGQEEHRQAHGVPVKVAGSDSV